MVEAMAVVKMGCLCAVLVPDNISSIEFSTTHEGAKLTGAEFTPEHSSIDYRELFRWNVCDVWRCYT